MTVAGVNVSRGHVWLRRANDSARWLVAPLLQALQVLLFVVAITFLLIRVIPGDPATVIGGPNATDETRAAIRAELHLDGGLPQQFVDYFSSLARGDLGHSLVVQPGQSVMSIIATALPVTLMLVLWTVFLALIIGVPIGLAAATRGRATDVAIRTGAVVSLAVPPFFVGLLLILLFVLRWPLFPAGGWSTSLGGAAYHLVLPGVALASYLTPLVVRATRQAACSAMAQPWVEAAAARGLSNRRLYLRHILPNSLLPVITLVGYNFGLLITAAVVVESVFSLPGIGHQLVDAINQRDYPLIQGIAVVSAVIVVLSNLAADLLAARVDPRIRRRS